MDLFDLRRWPGFPTAGGNLQEPAIVNQICIDSRRIDSPHCLFVALPGKRVDGHQYLNDAFASGAKFAVAKKGTSIPHINPNSLLLVEDPLRAFQEIAQAYRETLRATFIAISGSYGKTMVKDLLCLLLNRQFACNASPESFNSQIGVPLSLFTFSKTDEIAIVEAGVSLKGEMQTLAQMIKPHATVLTPLGRKYQATLGSMEEIIGEMLFLLKHPSCKKWVLLPDLPLLRSHLPHLHAPHFFWSSQIPPFAQATTNKPSSKIPYQILFPDADPYCGIMTSGFSYFLHLLNMATKAASLMGVSSQQIKEGLNTYRFEPMRQEFWESREGGLIINDIYCSDPQSVDQALQTLFFGDRQGKKTFVFGGMRGKNQGHSAEYKRIGKAIASSSLDAMYLFGDHAYWPLIEEVQKTRPCFKMIHKQTAAECLKELTTTHKRGDTILLKGTKKLSFDDVSLFLGETPLQNRCLINLAAIEANLIRLRQKIKKDARIMAIVKAFAYGTDMIRMARFYLSRGIDILGVSSVEEAVQLRKAGIACDLFVIHAPYYESKKIVDWNLEIGVSDLMQIETLVQEAKEQGKQAKLHLHIDTGMNRFGCRPEEALTLAKFIEQSSHVILQGVMTHLACADDPQEDAFTVTQIQRFTKCLHDLHNAGIHTPYRHAAASSALIRFDLPQCNMVRIGLALFGIHVSSATRQAIDLHQAISLLSRVVAISHCHKGDTISYGRRYRVEQEKQTIAVLPIGYHDGLHRHYSGKGAVHIRGKLAPMVGNICMDFLMVDVTDIPHVAVGDSALIFGEDEWGHCLPPEEVASLGNSITHELITCLGPRIQRIFVYEDIG